MAISRKTDGSLTPGEALRQLREEKHITRSQAAEVAGLDKTTLRNIETGYTRDPGITKVNKLSRAYQLSTHHFLELYGVEVDYGTPKDPHYKIVEQAAIDIIHIIWRAVRSGALDEQAAITDTEQIMHDVLNPDGLSSPEWLADDL